MIEEKERYRCQEQFCFGTPSLFLNMEGNKVIGLIAAVSKNGVIGKENSIPWHCPKDSQFFKRMTLNTNVIMGRKTFESLGKPLPNRTNVVVTRTPQDNVTDDVVYSNTIENAIDLISFLSNNKDAWIIGGSQIYKECLERSIPDRLLITRMNFEAEGDILFPTIPDNYKVTDIMNISSEFSVYRYDRLKS